MLCPAELRALEKHSILSQVDASGTRPYSAGAPPMFRKTFAWESQVRREVLEEELARLRDVPHSLWRELVSRPMWKTAQGRDNRTYRVRISPSWVNDSEDIRVTVALETPRLHRSLMRQSFLITPENCFRE